MFNHQHSAARSYSALFPVPFTRAHLSRGSCTYSHTPICTPTLPVTEHHHTLQSPLLSFSVFPFPPHVVPPGVFLLPAAALPHTKISHPQLVGGVSAYLSSAVPWLMSYFLPVRIFQNLSPSSVTCLSGLLVLEANGQSPRLPEENRAKNKILKQCFYKFALSGNRTAGVKSRGEKGQVSNLKNGCGVWV